jgi:hypothetical protein
LLVRDVSGAFKELNATLCGPRDLQASSFRMSLAESGVTGHPVCLTGT